MASILHFVFGIGLLVFTILMLVGLGYLTPVAFGKKSYSNMNTTQKNLMKMYIVVIWIGVVFSFLSSLWVIFGQNSSTSMNFY